MVKLLRRKRGGQEKLVDLYKVRGIGKIKFTRNVKKVGRCLSVIDRRGKPFLRARPFAYYLMEKWRGPRLSYHLNVKKVPRKCGTMKRGFILHLCHNEWCINPYHLYIGTPSDNSNDAYRRDPSIATRIGKSMRGNTNGKVIKDEAF